MDTRLSDPGKELYRRVDEVLHYRWDPIGISTVPSARNEYNAYVPHVFELLKEGASAAVITEYLIRVVRARIGMGQELAHTKKVADVLVAWREEVRGGG
ncbi:hypothetical protein [Cupriavidus alkaliphilus]|uniref:hypothetical protein n=1 Tax=Cupriavidus alkaliphilus TaxID=942866 RepID=UPI001611151D|nr:hypothetical protein [Cupriavidus alkaliphilus]MBB2917892.1 hypothetical protein [Cupriavidus alkaliphilus]